MFLPETIPSGPVVPYQQCVSLFGVDHMCLTRHSVGTHVSSFELLTTSVEGVPSTIWDIDVERTDRTFWGWEREGNLELVCMDDYDSCWPQAS